MRGSTLLLSVALCSAACNPDDAPATGETGESGETATTETGDTDETGETGEEEEPLPSAAVTCGELP